RTLTRQHVSRERGFAVKTPGPCHVLTTTGPRANNPASGHDRDPGSWKFQERPRTHEIRDRVTRFGTTHLWAVHPWTAGANSVIDVTPASDNREEPGISVKFRLSSRPHS